MPPFYQAESSFALLSTVQRGRPTCSEVVGRGPMNLLLPENLHMNGVSCKTQNAGSTGQLQLCMSQLGGTCVGVVNTVNLLNEIIVYCNTN